MNSIFNRKYFAFFEAPKSTLFLILSILVLHLIFAWQWPMLNDETYYWDWGRNLQLSYIDAPPGVSWVAFLGSKLFLKKIGARFLVPFLSLGTTLFLINSARILERSYKLSQRSTQIIDKTPLIVTLIFASIPIFTINGVLLMPDAILIFSCAGALYFALYSCFHLSKTHTNKLRLIHGILLGLFLGLCIISKYQAAPLAIGIFLAIVCFRGIKNTIKHDIIFWIATILKTLLISSPLIIWNFQNHFASFKFQGSHGFSNFDFEFARFLFYILAFFLILLPWNSYFFVRQVCTSIKEKDFLKSLNVIPIFSFFSIFIFIAISALGTRAEIHWITPSALFLIPLVGANWNTLVGAKCKTWIVVNFSAFILISLVALLFFTVPVQKFLSKDTKILGFNLQNLHDGIYRNLNWVNLDNPLQNFDKYIPSFSQVEKPYFKSLEKTKCKDEPYLASLNWRWTSQFAFYVPNQPRVFLLNPQRASYYSWRDSLENLSGCKVLILGEEHMYYKNEILEFVNIKSTKKFSTPIKFTKKYAKMISIEAVFKDSETLEKLSKKLKYKTDYN